MKLIRSIVERTGHQGVELVPWLSIGDRTKFHTPEAALLDELQFERDIIFVVAGTNNRDRHRDFPRIGAPADSLNSVVVNAVSLSGRPVEYSRKGPVLHFYKKPDAATFGGDREDGMVVYSSRGRVKVMGTSYAAPWVARKLAYLIHIMGFSREVAKALLLDASAGWNVDATYQDFVGFGRVPTHISDILTTGEDEIKFVIHGISEAYQTYAYSIPVPMYKEQFPYIAKATLCYFRNVHVCRELTITDMRWIFTLDGWIRKGR